MGVIRQLYGLGADFKTHDGCANESMQSMATKDPLYQLIKYQIRDVTDQVVDIVADVLVPLFQALFKAQNEYGWGSNSCAPGSISFVVAVLEGRLDVDAPVTQKKTPQTGRRTGTRDRYA